jgi:GT2 family glycosyltransferase
MLIPVRHLVEKIYYANGFEYHTTRYQESDLGNVLWYAGGIVDWNNAWTTHRGVNEVDHGGYNEVEETEFVTGCLFCFDQVVVEKVGMWDEEYFLYYEDADYSERIKRAGISLLYNPHIAIWHKNAQSSDGSGSKLHEKLQRKSHLRYALKYAPLRTKIHVLKNYFLRR